MRSLKNLDIGNSIQAEKLIFKENGVDKFDRFTNYLIFFALIISSILSLKEIDSDFTNNKIEYFIFSTVIAFSLYGFYCKFSEKYLKEIKFNIHREDAKQRILEYGKRYNYRISKISNELIFLNELTDISNYGFGNYEKTIFIFFKDNCILYTIIKEGFRLNAPVLFSQYIIKRDLKKILKMKK